MNILVTGANGYLGQGIVKRLLDMGIDVKAAGTSLTETDPRAERYEADIFSIEDPYEYFGRPDRILHLAWRNGFRHGAVSHMEELPKHYRFLRKLIMGADESGDGIKHVAVMGSMHEVGFHEGAVDENTPENPHSLYGISKNALRQSIELLKEESVFKEKEGFVLQWLRGYYIVGNTDYGCSIFSKLTEAAKRGDSSFPFTSGQNEYDFLDYDEFCRQAAAAVTQQEINGIINLCSGRPEKLGSRVERFIAENGFDIKLDYGAFPDRPYDSKCIWGDNTKIQNILKSL